MVLKRLQKSGISFLFLFACVTHLFAGQIPVPAFKDYVNDYANVIDSRTEQEMNNYLGNLERSTGVQLAVLTVPSLKGEDIASFSVRTAENWGVGRNGKDNGALLILAMEERDVRIEVGYGLEDKLTDAKCGLILRNVIIPEFRDGNYSQGLYKGIKNMAGIATNDASLVSSHVQNEEDNDIGGLFLMIIWLIFFLVVITSKNGLFKWLILGRMFGTPSYRGRRNSFPTGGFGGPTFKSGSSFGGGFGGSGFHGGGGGHFGGGGATGHF